MLAGSVLLQLVCVVEREHLWFDSSEIGTFSQASFTMLNWHGAHSHFMHRFILRLLSSLLTHTFEPLDIQVKPTLSSCFTVFNAIDLTGVDEGEVL